MGESKAKDTLMLILYVLGAIAGIIVVALIWMFLGPILEFIELLECIAGAVAVLLVIIVGAYYLLFDPENPDKK